jgi:hypothetical protein
MRRRKFEVIVHPKVFIDLQLTIDFYNKERDFLGNEFYIIALDRLKSLKNDALLYQVRYEDVRCLKIARFPFLIHFSVDAEFKKVLVHAVISTHKNPIKNWIKRAF